MQQQEDQAQGPLEIHHVALIMHDPLQEKGRIGVLVQIFR